MKAVKCPVCDGSGQRFKPGALVYVDDPKRRIDTDCPGCQGKCWVEVSEDGPPAIVHVYSGSSTWCVNDTTGRSCPFCPAYGRCDDRCQR